MKLVQEYRRRAEEFRGLAVRSASKAERDLIQGMAETWDGLANQRETYLKRKSSASMPNEPFR